MRDPPLNMGETLLGIKLLNVQSVRPSCLFYQYDYLPEGLFYLHVIFIVIGQWLGPDLGSRSRMEKYGASFPPLAWVFTLSK